MHPSSLTTHCQVKATFRSPVVGLVALMLIVHVPFACGQEPSHQVSSPVEAFLTQYCVECHSGNEAPVGLDMKTLSRDLTQPDDLRRWIRMYAQIGNGMMPPADSQQPAPDLKASILASLERTIETAEALTDSRTPRLRRLTRREYENIIRDLFDMPGIALADNLPADGKANGFDRVPGALDLSHVNMAKYLEAADHILDYAICVRPDPPTISTRRISLVNRGGFVAHIVMNGDGVLLKDGLPDPDFPPAGEQNHLDEGAHERWGSFENGASVGLFRHEDESVNPYFIEHVTIYPARYRVRTSLWSFQWDKGTVLPGRGIEAARLSVVQLTGDGRGGQHPSYVLGYFNAPVGKPLEHELMVWLNHNELIGFNTASLAPAANYYKPKRALEFTGPGIVVDWLDIEGPLYASWPPASHRMLFGDLPLAEFRAEDNPGVRAPVRQRPRQLGAGKNRPDPEPGIWTVRSERPLEDAKALLANALPKLFRRPVGDDVIDEYVTIVESRLKEGDCFEFAMRAAYRSALVSPDFLFHIESSDGTGVPLDSFGLANRLSSLLWNSGPDEPLAALAASGELQRSDVLHREVERLLKDERSKRFVNDFLGQWLRLYEIAANDPDKKLYPEFSPYLQDAMIAETRTFLHAALENDARATEFVRSDYVMVNEKLASHYGIPGVAGTQIRRVQIPEGCPRGGLLTQGSILKVTANGTTTSPVPRGAFVMGRLLGETPEPPPTNVPAIEPDVRGATTIRDQLEKHRDNAVCASCHRRMDPPGFALEAFDVIGGYRTRYRSIGEGDPAERGNIDPFIGLSFRLGREVDASGAMPDGREFQDIRAFQAILAGDEKKLLENLAKQFLLYGTGRVPGFRDRALLDQIVEQTRSRGGGIRTLLHNVIGSRLFLEIEGKKASSEADGTTQFHAVGIEKRHSVVEGAADRERLLLNPIIPTVEKPVRRNPIATEPEGRTPAGAEFVDARTVRVRVRGLFIPEQVEAFRSRMDQVDQAILESLDYDTAEALIRFSVDGDMFRNATDDQVIQRLNDRMQHVSRGLFSFRPVGSLSPDALQRIDFPIVGLDCKACSLAVHDNLIRQEGVVHAKASFHDGLASAWIDPMVTDRTKLVEALRHAQVTLREAE